MTDFDAALLPTPLSVPGGRLHVRRSGEGEPLVLVHGTGTDSHVWDAVVPHLTATHTVVAYDRRGYGLSLHRPVRDYRVHSRDLIAVLDHVGPAHVVGWSSGGNTALAAAVEDPRRLRSLTLLEPPFHLTRTPNRAMTAMLVRTRLEHLMGQDARAGATFFRWASRCQNGPPGWDRLPEVTRHELTSNALQILAELKFHPFGVLCEHVPTRKLRRLEHLPVAWVIGALSPDWYRIARRRACRHLPNASMPDLPGASHFALIERPDALAAQILATTGRASQGTRPDVEARRLATPDNQVNQDD